MITQALLKEFLHYDPLTGHFSWVKRSGRGQSPIGSRAGWLSNTGYTVIEFKQKNYAAHRLAFLYMLGKFPPHEVDHQNGVKLDNRWENLRAATRAQNNQNRRTVSKRNPVGILGVFKTESGRFAASLSINYKKVHIGIFSTPEEAHSAYVEAKRKLHEFNTL